jgi:hypothetical protein
VAKQEEHRDIARRCWISGDSTVWIQVGLFADAVTSLSDPSSAWTAKANKSV